MTVRHESTSSDRISLHIRSIRVEKPEKTTHRSPSASGGGVGTFTSYLITTEVQIDDKIVIFHSRRRFREFESFVQSVRMVLAVLDRALEVEQQQRSTTTTNITTTTTSAKHLRNGYKHFVSMPRKTVFDRFKPSVIEQRRKKFQELLQWVIQQRQLLESDLVQRFIGVSDHIGIDSSNYLTPRRARSNARFVRTEYQVPQSPGREAHGSAASNLIARVASAVSSFSFTEMLAAGDNCVHPPRSMRCESIDLAAEAWCDVFRDLFGGRILFGLDGLVPHRIRTAQDLVASVPRDQWNSLLAKCSHQILRIDPDHPLDICGVAFWQQGIRNYALGTSMGSPLYGPKHLFHEKNNFLYQSHELAIFHYLTVDGTMNIAFRTIEERDTVRKHNVWKRTVASGPLGRRPTLTNKQQMQRYVDTEELLGKCGTDYWAYHQSMFVDVFNNRELSHVFYSLPPGKHTVRYELRFQLLTTRENNKTLKIFPLRDTPLSDVLASGEFTIDVIDTGQKDKDEQLTEIGSGQTDVVTQPSVEHNDDQADAVMQQSVEHDEQLPLSDERPNQPPTEDKPVIASPRRRRTAVFGRPDVENSPVIPRTEKKETRVQRTRTVTMSESKLLSMLDKLQEQFEHTVEISIDSTMEEPTEGSVESPEEIGNGIMDERCNERRASVLQNAVAFEPLQDEQAERENESILEHEEYDDEERCFADEIHALRQISVETPYFLYMASEEGMLLTLEADDQLQQYGVSLQQKCFPLEMQQWIFTVNGRIESMHDRSLVLEVRNSRVGVGRQALKTQGNSEGEVDDARVAREWSIMFIEPNAPTRHKYIALMDNVRLVLDVSSKDKNRVQLRMLKDTDDEQQKWLIAQ